MTVKSFYIKCSLTVAALALGGYLQLRAQSDEVGTTGTVTVSGEELYSTASSNLTNTFAGLLPGLTVMQGTGELGNDTAHLLVRGMGSYGVGSWNTAKYFVDGFEVNREYVISLSPSEIESVAVLKDGAALSLYGERGANGVIQITTKRGKVGKASLTARIRGGAQTPSVINKPLGSYEFASLYNQAISNDNGMVWSPAYSDSQLSAYKNGTGVDVDWYDEVLRGAGSAIDGDIIINGGDDNAAYNINLGYVRNRGLLNVPDSDKTRNLGYSKFNLRTNLDFKVLKIFEVKVDIGGRIETLSRPNYSTSSLFSNLSRYPSNIYNVYDSVEEEHYSGTAVYPDNPYASIAALGWAQNKARSLQGNFSVRERLDFLLRGLYLQESFSFYSYTLSAYSKTRNYARYYLGNTTTTDETTTMTASGYGSNGMQDWKQGKLTLGFDRSFGKNNISSQGNFIISAYKGDGYFSYKYNYVNLNAFIHYDFDRKYVAEVGMSYFGNDAFAPGNRWAFYPSLSGAWIASNEDFLKGNETVNFLKVRASAGLSGAADTSSTAVLANYSSNGRFLYKDYYTTSYIGSFYTGKSAGTWQSTLVPMFTPNADIHAEKSLKFNVGVDMRLFGGLDLTVDAFLDKRSDILTLDNTLMSYYGKQYCFSNLGKMTNRGGEASLSYTGKGGGFDYKIFGTASYAHNTVDEMSEIAPANPFSAQTGRPFGTYIGLVADGFYDINDFDADGNLLDSFPSPAFGSVQPGDVKYLDLDRNGVVDQRDVTKIGRAWYPEWNFTFGGKVAYGGFDLQVLFQGVAGVSYNLLDNWNQMVAFVDNGNAYPIAQGAWAYYPTEGIDTRNTATYPRLSTQANENNYRLSTMWVKDASFLKLRVAELGYNFSSLKLKEAGIDNLRVWLSGNNLLTFSPLMSKYNLDPESRSGQYPSVRSCSMGVSITF